MIIQLDSISDLKVGLDENFGPPVLPKNLTQAQNISFRKTEL